MSAVTPFIVGRCLYGRTDAVAAFVGGRCNAEFDGCEAIGILDRDGVSLVGGVVYSEWRGHDIRASIAGDVGFLSRAVLRQIFAYPFLQLGCNRITCAIRAGNDASERLALKLGFIREGLLRGGDTSGDDLIIVGMLKKECRWLETRHG